MDRRIKPNESPGRLRRIANYLSLERNVVAASGAVFLLGFGEELWKKFLPKYLQALGASVPTIGLFGAAEDLFDAVYQYPGGWIADRLGRRSAFFVFLSLACIGYLVYLLGPSWPFAFVGLAFVMAWQSMASPAIFAVIGDVLVILYVTNVLHVSVARFGTLLAILFLTTILIYLPAAKAADRVGPRPFIIATFCAFALYPLSIIAVHNFAGLVIAFIIGGLREIGEPARKAMIVDSAQPQLRARSVGLYYLLRSLAITPAAAIGGLLWKITPQTPFVMAGIFGVAGVFIFIATVRE